MGIEQNMDFQSVFDGLKGQLGGEFNDPALQPNVPGGGQTPGGVSPGDNLVLDAATDSWKKLMDSVESASATIRKITQDLQALADAVPSGGAPVAQETLDRMQDGGIPSASGGRRRRRSSAGDEDEDDEDDDFDHRRRSLHLYEMRAIADNPLLGSVMVGKNRMWRKVGMALQAKTLGGSFEAMGGGMGAGASIAGASMAALYGGFQLPEWAANWAIKGWDTDAQNVFADYRASNILGKSFDIRNALADGGDRKLASIHNDINRANVRAAIQGMGISFEGSGVDEESLYKFMDTGLMRRDKTLGLQDGALAGFLGQQIRSGSVSRDENDMQKAVDRVAGLIAEGNKSGVAAQESLATLVGLNQMAEGRMGFVSHDSGRYLEGLQAMLTGSGLASLRGSGGARAMGAIASNSTPEFEAAVYAQFAGNPKALEKAGLAAFGKDGWAAAKKAAHGDQGMLALAVAEDPVARLSFAQEWLKGAGSHADTATKGAFLGMLGIPKGQMLHAMGLLEQGSSPAAVAKYLEGAGHSQSGLGALKDKEAQATERVVGLMGELALGIDKVRMSAALLEETVRIKAGQADMGARGRSSAAGFVERNLAPSTWTNGGLLDGAAWEHLLKSIGRSWTLMH